MTRPLALAALLLVAVAVIALLRSGSGFDRRVSFVVPQATDLFDGLKVRAAGQDVGRITAVKTVDAGRAARVELRITDRRVWPLPRDTRLRLRFGGTVSYAARYIALDRGTASGPSIPDGGTVPSANVEYPVEFDEVFNTFGRRTRHNLRATLDSAGAALRPAANPLRRALATAPDVVHQAQGAFSDLGPGQATLSTLVRSSDRVLSATQRATPGVGELVTNASTTFAAIGARASDLRRTLDELPRTLASARATLEHSDRTLVAATKLSGELRPGVERLILITPPLQRILRTLVDVAPDAADTLAVARSAAPDITGLLDQATTVMPKVRSLAEQADPQLGCIRPYAPEIAGWMSTWTSFVGAGDGKDKYARLFNSAYPFPNDTPFGAARGFQLFPGVFASYAFPRPPGANVNQPWFLPECGITPQALDPLKDPEDLANPSVPVQAGVRP